MAIQFLNSVNLSQNELIKARIENQPNNAAAGTGVEGQLYYDTTADVLKVWANGAWVEVGGGVTSFTASSGSFISLSPTTAQTGAATLTANLSATGTPDSTVYLRGDNTWSPVAAIPGTYTWSIQGGTGGPTTISSGTNVTFSGGTNITTALAGNTLTVNHGSVTRSDTTSTASPAFGATFTAVDSITSSAQGHVTAINLKTVTLPTPVNPTITLSGDVTGSGTTSISTTIASGAVEFSMMDPTAVVTSSEGIGSNNNDVTLPTSAAVKSYVDTSLVGSLIFQGGYNALTNTPNLDTPPTGTIKKGFMWTVTTDGFFFTEQVRTGDSLIANIDTPTTLADWTRVQSNIDLATLTTVGIGNVNAGTGISVSYSAGTATVTADTVSYAQTVSTATATLTHSLGTRDVIVQLYDTVTYDTVYADTIRTTIDTVTINFAATPTNPVRVLVQK
jgi:hypothetical protein